MQTPFTFFSFWCVAVFIIAAAMFSPVCSFSGLWPRHPPAYTLNQQYFSVFLKSPLCPLHTHTHWPWPLCTTCSECRAGMPQSTAQAFAFVSYSSLWRVRQSPSSHSVSLLSLKTICMITHYSRSAEREAAFLFRKAYHTWFIACASAALYIEERNSWTVMTRAI